MEFALGGCRYPKNCSASEEPSLAAEPRWVEGTAETRTSASEDTRCRPKNREAPLSGGLPPQEGYFTLSTVMVSPLNLPLIVTSLPAIGVTFAWSAIL